MKYVTVKIPYRGTMIKALKVSEDMTAKEAIKLYNDPHTGPTIEIDELDACVDWSGKAVLVGVEIIDQLLD